MPSKATNDNRVMYSKGHNAEIMICKETGTIIIDLLKIVLLRYQKCLEELMKVSEFIFDCLYGLVYKFHKLNINLAR